MKPIMLLLAFLCLSAVAETRTWTEAASGRTLQGEFVGVRDDKVTLRRADGTIVQLSLTRLIEADQAFVQQHSIATAKPAIQAKTQGDLKERLVGTWEGFMADSDGSPHGAIRLVVTANEITATNPQGERVMGGGTYVITKAGTVSRIDAKGTSGQFDQRSYEGIFTIEGRTLKWCSANDNPRSQRPEKLQTNAQAGQFLMVLEKKD